MGFIYAEITLENTTDAMMAKRGLIKESEVRRETVRALVDTGAATVVIGEDLRKRLGLSDWIPGKSTLAGGQQTPSYWTEPAGVHWENRTTGCSFIVLPKQEQVLLGNLALEGMDLMPDPLHETLVGKHGDEPVALVM
jgi:hypothetical protein